jgi:glycosyltransferase involved in cell wall biosynthesis
MEKPRILIIENSIDVTGALKSITRTAYDLKEHFEFQFVIPAGSRGRSWIEGNGFTVIHELPMLEISRRFSSLVMYLPILIVNAFRLSRIARKEKIELIHVNDLYNLLPVVHRLFGGTTPYISHIRFLPDRFPKPLFDFWLKLHLRYAGKIITVSHAVMRQLSGQPNIIVIHDELPFEERYPQILNPVTATRMRTFLYLSNFIQGKGQNFALEAFAKIHSQIPNWRLRFVGGDMGLKKNRAYRSELQNMAKELGIFEETAWLGFTEDVEREYKDADVVLNFSESESFSITCLEALFFGRPVIATDSGGPAEIIEHNQTGLLVANGSIEAIAYAMLDLAKNDELRQVMRNKARQSVRSKFSIENTSYRVRSVYRYILNYS